MGKFPLDTVRHSTAHLMAAAIQRLFPEALFGVGPPVSNGFYYDIRVPNRQIGNEDLTAIQDVMLKIKNQNVPFKRQEYPIDQAISEMAKRN